MRGVLYGLMGWFCVIAAFNGYAGNYDMGLLLVYGMLPTVVALGAESMGPVWQFLGFGLLTGTVGAVLGPASTADTLVLNGSLATVALVEEIAIRSQLAGQARLERQNDLFARDLANIGTWVYTVSSETLFWTQQVREIHGLPSDCEPAAEEAIEFYHPDDRPVIRELFRRAIEEGKSYDEELRLAVADEGHRWVRGRGTPQTEDGEVVRVRGTFQDITERVERERELERKNVRLDSFAGLVSHDLRNPLNVATGRLRLAKEEDDPSHLDAIGRALGRMDAIIEDVLTLTWSGRDIGPEELAIQDLTPLAEEEPLGKTPRILQGPETEWDVLDSLRAAPEAGESWEGETVNYRKDGTPYRVHWNIAPVRGEDGQIEHWISVQRDVTERKRREERLRRRQVVESLYDATGRLLRAESQKAVSGRIHEVLQEVFDYPLSHTGFLEERPIVPERPDTAEGLCLPQAEPRPLQKDTVVARALQAGEAVVGHTEALDNPIDYGDLRSAAGMPIGKRGAIVVGKTQEGKAQEGGFDPRRTCACWRCWAATPRWCLAASTGRKSSSGRRKRPKRPTE